MEKRMQLVTIAKNGERINVHPDTLAEHMKLGWVVCERQEADPDDPAPADEPVKRRGRPAKAKAE